MLVHYVHQDHWDFENGHDLHQWIQRAIRRQDCEHTPLGMSARRVNHAIHGTAEYDDADRYEYEECESRGHSMWTQNDDCMPCTECEAADHCLNACPE